MINLLCASQGVNIGITVGLIVVMLVILIIPYVKQKKQNEEYLKMMDAIRVGDMVKTAGGIIGKITKITDKGEIKTVVLETGSKTNKSYMEIDFSMIYCVLKSTKTQEEAKVEEKTEAETPVEVKTTEEKPVETKVAEEKPNEAKADEAKVEKAEAKKPASKKPVAKKSATKKTAAKKTTAKKSTKSAK